MLLVVYLATWVWKSNISIAAFANGSVPANSAVVLGGLAAGFTPGGAVSFTSSSTWISSSTVLCLSR